MKTSKNLIIAGLLAGALVAPITAEAADENDIIELEKKLITIESQLLEPELRLDELQEERAKYDGVSGWFQGSKKKALEAEITKQESLISDKSSEMTSVSQQVQNMVFEVGKAYEKNGQYKKAIEYYLKVENRTDKVRERIACSYKALKDYKQAIKWFLEMNRTDNVLFEVAECFKLNGSMKEAVFWLFKIVEDWNGNSVETAVLKVIEDDYNYAGRLKDYPDFFKRLSDVYLFKSVNGYSSNSSLSAADYKKASQLLGEHINDSENAASLAILGDCTSAYEEALEILERQREAAERNYEDSLRNAEGRIHDAEHRLRMARGDADRDYDNRLRNAEQSLKRAKDKLREVESKPDANPDEIKRVKASVDLAEREFQRIRNNKMQIVADYMRPYEHAVREAKGEYDRLVRDRTNIIEDYIAPFKKKVSKVKAYLGVVKALHNAVYGS